MLTDLIAANANEAPTILQSNSHSSGWPRLEAKGVDQVKLASLRFILKGIPPDDEPVIVYMELFEPLADGGDDGPWIVAVPDELLNLLASVHKSEVSSICVAWANTEEAKLDSWEASEIEPHFCELIRFANDAIAKDKRLLLWTSL